MAINTVLDARKTDMLNRVSEFLKHLTCVHSAILYGSWIYQDGVDLDIAVIVESENGIIPISVYHVLADARQKLIEMTNTDVDLICHSDDEINDNRSPLWHPRYNPPLAFGVTIKGKFSITSCSIKKVSFDYADICMYTLFDHRALCRRQMLRPFSQGSAEFVLGRFLHGPANALVYHCCKHHMELLCSTSDVAKSFVFFDKYYSVDSEKVLSKLTKLIILDMNTALPLMNWYEALVSLARGVKRSREFYLTLCEQIL